MSNSVSVLVNSYNYAAFVAEAIASAVNQSFPPLEVIVVDDGSTDETSEILDDYFGQNPLVRVIRQRNSGQLAALVAGFEAAAGDLVFLLDADDRYERHHLERVVSTYENHPEVDFVFTGHRQFGQAHGVCRLAPHDRLLGFSAVRTFQRGAWVGSVTSTLSLRRSLMLALLPSLRALAPRWKIRADDCVVIGASMAGSQKYFLAEATVNYRVHAQNNFHGRHSGESSEYAHWLRREALIDVLARDLGLQPHVALRADVEFRCLPNPTRSEYLDYLAIVRDLRLPVIKRLKMRLNLYLHFRRAARIQSARVSRAGLRPPPDREFASDTDESLAGR